MALELWSILPLIKSEVPMVLTLACGGRDGFIVQRWRVHGDLIGTAILSFGLSHRGADNARRSTPPA